MTLTKWLLLAGVWYVVVIAATRYWYRRRPPPRHGDAMAATDWVAAMPTQPGTPPHGTPMKRCRFHWQSPNLSLDAEADDTHRCALFTIHTDHHICPCGAIYETDHEVEQ